MNSEFKAGDRIWAPGAPRWVPRGTVVRVLGKTILVQLDKTRGVYMGHYSKNGGLTIRVAAGPSGEWSYEAFGHNPPVALTKEDIEAIYDRARAWENDYDDYAARPCAPSAWEKTSIGSIC